MVHCVALAKRVERMFYLHHVTVMDERILRRIRRQNAGTCTQFRQ